MNRIVLRNEAGFSLAGISGFFAAITALSFFCILGGPSLADSPGNTSKTSEVVALFDKLATHKNESDFLDLIDGYVPGDKLDRLKKVTRPILAALADVDEYFNKNPGEILNQKDLLKRYCVSGSVFQQYAAATALFSIREDYSGFDWIWESISDDKLPVARRIISARSLRASLKMPSAGGLPEYGKRCSQHVMTLVSKPQNLEDDRVLAEVLQDYSLPADDREKLTEQLVRRALGAETTPELQRRVVRITWYERWDAIEPLAKLISSGNDIVAMECSLMLAKQGRAASEPVKEVWKKNDKNFRWEFLEELASGDAAERLPLNAKVHMFLTGEAAKLYAIPEREIEFNSRRMCEWNSFLMDLLKSVSFKKEENQEAVAQLLVGFIIGGMREQEPEDAIRTARMLALEWQRFRKESGEKHAWVKWRNAHLDASYWDSEKLPKDLPQALLSPYSVERSFQHLIGQFEDPKLFRNPDPKNLLYLLDAIHEWTRNDKGLLSPVVAGSSGNK